GSLFRKRSPRRRKARRSASGSRSPSSSGDRCGRCSASTRASPGCATRAWWRQAMPPRARASTKSSTAKSREAYVDTSALIAFTDRSDTHHPLFLRLFSDPGPLLTTPLVIAEGHAWFVRRYDPTRGLQFLSMVEEMAPLEIVPVGQR